MRKRTCACTHTHTHTRARARVPTHTLNMQKHLFCDKNFKKSQPTHCDIFAEHGNDHQVLKISKIKKVICINC
jgi:hypothetical protein